MGNCLAVPVVKEGGAGGAKAARSAAAPAGSEPEILPHTPEELKELANSMLGAPKATDILQKYELGPILGRGAYATTRLAIDRATGQRFACKTIVKRHVEGAGDAGDVRTELDIMLHLSGHPHIVELVDTFEDEVFVHLVEEFCAGGDLVQRILKKGSYTERDAAAVLRALLGAVAYAHDLGVVHRDIKPDNCLMLDDSDAAPLKLADWGFSTFVHPTAKLTTLAGTCYYVAPEVLLGAYDEKADVWSCGVFLYVLLCGAPPFYAVRDEDVYRKIMDDGVPNMSAHPWPSISEEAKDAVRQMMTWGPEARPSARDMLGHEWVREGGAAGDNLVQPEVLHRLQSFAAMNNLKRHAAQVIASHLPFDQIRGLQELFTSIDADRDGVITLEEMAKALEERGAKLPKEDLSKLMDLADLNSDGKLDYEEFLSATMQERRLNEEDNLLWAFKHYDTDGDGKISQDELRTALASAGHPHEDGPEKVMAAADADGDGFIDYGEFVRMMHCGGSESCPGHGRGVFGRLDRGGSSLRKQQQQQQQLQQQQQDENRERKEEHQLPQPQPQPQPQGVGGQSPAAINPQASAAADTPALAPAAAPVAAATAQAAAAAAAAAGTGGGGSKPKAPADGAAAAPVAAAKPGPVPAAKPSAAKPSAAKPSTAKGPAAASKEASGSGHSGGKAGAASAAAKPAAKKKKAKGKK